MKSILLVLALFCITLHVKAQNYNDVLYYATNITPVNGVKLKTNIPFTNSSQMVTIMIEGYAYVNADPINLIFTYYIYNGAFINSRVSTSGSHNPNITLANENGKVSIFINSKVFFQRFHVKAVAGGNGEQPAWFAGWSAVDSLLIGTASAQYTIPYKNSFVNTIFTGTTNLPAGVWDTLGRVGIGTVVPSARLSIGGSVANDAAITLQSGVDSRFYLSEGDNTLRIGGLNAATGVINVINTGNVGIGTTAPGSYKLAVEGTIGARKVQVKQTSWADFVFAKDYKLLPLSAVEKYVNENKHLPGVPSAAEVQKDGQDLGEMNKILLQKVEELTLHLIELEKQVSRLQTQQK